jgi:hypothetical protein
MSDTDTAWSAISGHTHSAPKVVNVDLTSMLDMPGVRVEGHRIDYDNVDPLNPADLQAPTHKPSASDKLISTSLDSQDAVDFVLGFVLLSVRIFSNT